MKVPSSGVGNHTDKPEHEIQFLRQQDLAIISTAGQSDTLRQSKNLQSISNAYNEKHIFFSASEKIISSWTEGSTGPLH